MGFIDSLLTFFTVLIGGTIFILLTITTVFCGIAALLSIAEENRVVFMTSKKIVAFIIATLGLLLPLRGVSIIGTGITLSFLLSFFDVFKVKNSIAPIASAVCALIFWIVHHHNSSEYLLQVIGDFLIFVIIPTIFSLVNLARGAEFLSEGDGGDSKSFHFNLRSFLSKSYSLLITILPPN
ncbi:hypothetical protein TRFO_11142 [Tritrichomonas foetus]|uniref:Uncharacterized protein n=1 Tax=Tritrichomonas foetus TaxID=1144522 RepID=A0A1J4J5H5_9EUKA|nr:hypothetical protein TRFO_11142 [Tritrichomonas foetus]|eukprot:OHS94504.1 hypothetical protein TRFO_11142 [Tritrichomonas foetus]